MGWRCIGRHGSATRVDSNYFAPRKTASKPPYHRQHLSIRHELTLNKAAQDFWLSHGSVAANHIWGSGEYAPGSMSKVSAEGATGIGKSCTGREGLGSGEYDGSVRRAFAQSHPPFILHRGQGTKEGDFFEEGLKMLRLGHLPPPPRTTMKTTIVRDTTPRRDMPSIRTHEPQEKTVNQYQHLPSPQRVSGVSG